MFIVPSLKGCLRGPTSANLPECSGNKLIPDDGRLPCSAWGRGLARRGPPSGPSGCCPGVPWPRHPGLLVARHRPPKILVGQTVAPAFLYYRICPWPPWRHPFGGCGGGMRLGPSAWRRSGLGRASFGGRLPFPSRRGHAHAGRTTACLAAAQDLGTAALQVRLANRATGGRAAAILGRVRQPGPATPAGGVGPIRHDLACSAACGGCASCQG